MPSICDSAYSRKEASIVVGTREASLCDLPLVIQREMNCERGTDCYLACFRRLHPFVRPADGSFGLSSEISLVFAEILIGVARSLADDAPDIAIADEVFALSCLVASPHTCKYSQSSFCRTMFGFVTVMSYGCWWHEDGESGAKSHSKMLWIWAEAVACDVRQKDHSSLIMLRNSWCKRFLTFVTCLASNAGTALALAG